MMFTAGAFALTHFAHKNPPVADIEHGIPHNPAHTNLPATPPAAYIPSRAEALSMSADIATTVSQHHQSNNTSEGSSVAKKVMNYVQEYPFRTKAIGVITDYSIAAVTTLGVGISKHNAQAIAAGGALLFAEALLAYGFWEDMGRPLPSLPSFRK